MLQAMRNQLWAHEICPADASDESVEGSYFNFVQYVPFTFRSNTSQTDELHLMIRFLVDHWHSDANTRAEYCNNENANPLAAHSAVTQQPNVMYPHTSWLNLRCSGPGVTGSELVSKVVPK